MYGIDHLGAKGEKTPQFMHMRKKKNKKGVSYKN